MKAILPMIRPKFIRERDGRSAADRECPVIAEYYERRTVLMSFGSENLAIFASLSEF